MYGMKFTVILLFFIISANGLLAQQKEYEIVIKKGFRTRFFQNDKKLSYPEFNSLLVVVPDAQLEMKKARHLQNVSVILQAGSFLLFVSQFEDQILQRGRPNLLLLAAGMGASHLVRIPFRKPIRRHFQNAVDIYNTEVVEHRRLNLEFDINLGANGIGLSLTF